MIDWPQIQHEIKALENNAWISCWICGQSIILSWDFLLLGRGLPNRNVPPCLSLKRVRNHGSDNSLKWPQIIKRGKGTASSTP